MHQYFLQLLPKCLNLSQAQQELKWLALYVLKKSKDNKKYFAEKQKKSSYENRIKNLSLKTIIKSFNENERILLNELIRERVEKSKPLQYII
ncbi:13286_t:CDS:1, partial [Acaulospora morrowiae]